jgi:SAM-dependent methyltransferase
VFNIEREEAVFLHKSLLSPDALDGKLVLDAGCGNGRYSYWASQFGARVVGIDLGAGVESAHANTRHLDNVQIVQADIFRLPFARETFDRVFSIGVLMHTGDARKATESLAGRLKPGGSVTVHLYGKGNAVYEYVDRALRRRTVRLSIDELSDFTRRAWRVTRFLERLRLLPLVDCFIRLDPHPHCIFDWYSAPIATHHTYPEVEAWFAAMGMRVVQTNKPRGWKSQIRSAITADTVTVRAERQA